MRSDQSQAVKAVGVYHVECYGSDGNMKWTEDAPNALYDEGEFMILDVALRGGTAPANFFIGLLKNSLATAPVETSTLASLPVSTHEPTNATEPGYAARQQVNRDATASGWPTLVLNSGDHQATSKTVSWTASANWTGTLRWIFLTSITTVADTTGKLFSLAQLSADRTLLSGDTLQVTYSLKLT